MSFTRMFDGKATLAELEKACVDMQIVKTANLLSVEGRNGQLDDGTAIKVNVVKFDPKDSRNDVIKNLKFVKKDEADFEQMVREGRSQVGDVQGMDIFIGNQAETILIFGKKN